MGSRLRKIRKRWKNAPSTARKIEVYIATPIGAVMDSIGWPAAVVMYRLWLLATQYYRNDVRSLRFSLLSTCWVWLTSDGLWW